SSRRRHTRWPRDWSSDVCSSDLMGTWVTLCGTKCRKPGDPVVDEEGKPIRRQSVSVTLRDEWITCEACKVVLADPPMLAEYDFRSEERRVGKEGRDQRWTDV